MKRISKIYCRLILNRVFLCCALLTLISCKETINSIVEYIPYAELPPDYTLENAKDDHLVVFENGNITSGQDIWDAFLQEIEQGKQCMVRLAFYYSLDNQNIDPDYYEKIKDDYPHLFIQDLSFDGQVYTLYSVEDGKEYAFQYKYLKKFYETSPVYSTAEYSEAIRYVLINDNEVTWEQIIKGMLSSRMGQQIDHKTVYSKIIYTE